MVANKINSSSKKFMDKMDSSFFQIGGDGATLNMTLDEEEDNKEEKIIVDDIDKTSSNSGDEEND